MELQKIKLRDGIAPKYLQIKEFLFEHIRKNDFKIGAVIPSENELAETFGVTAVTASRAINELVNEGFLYRIRGKGTFVNKISEAAPPVYLFSTGDPFNDPYFSAPLFTIIANTLARNGLSLTVKYIKETCPINLPSSNTKSGIAIVPALNIPQRLSEASIQNTQIPIINIGAHPEEPFDCVSFNNREGMAQLMKYLVELGHRRIAFFSAEEENISNMERINEYKAAADRYRLVKDDSLIFPGHYSKESGRQSAKALFEMEKRPTAVVCSSDVIAVGALEIFQKAGLRVPDDISITGFGDYEIASYTNPNLTTVELPVKKMGEELTNLVLLRMKNPNGIQPQRIAIPTTLVIRESTGIPTKATGGDNKKRKVYGKK